MVFIIGMLGLYLSSKYDKSSGVDCKQEHEHEKIVGFNS